MSLCRGRRKYSHKSGFVKSSALRWIRGDLRFNDTPPRPDYFQRLIEHFRESSSPNSMRRVLFSSEKSSASLCEYASASFHLPGAYVESFPCPQCTHPDEHEETFVEVFHVANVHNPTVCATVTFTIPAVISAYFIGCCVKVEFSKGCPKAYLRKPPYVADHSPRVALHIRNDVLIRVLRFLPRSDLETALLVSRRWSQFYGESSGMLSACFLRKEKDRIRILRVLTPRGLSQALFAIRSHLRNAFVRIASQFFVDTVPATGPPDDVLVDIPLPARINLLTSLLHSMPRNSLIDSWSVGDTAVGFSCLPTLARCAMTPHRKLGCVRRLELLLTDRNATWAQLATLLNQPSVRGFREITITTTVTIDTAGLRAVLSSWRSPKLHLLVLNGTHQQDALLTLPAQLVRDFVALPDVRSFVTEFSLRLEIPSPIPEMPNVNDADGRRKRFRYRLEGVDTVVRVNVYANRAAREFLTVVTFDHFHLTVRIFKGNVPLAYLKLTLRRYKYF